eukprot:gene7210-5067_t
MRRLKVRVRLIYFGSVSARNCSHPSWIPKLKEDIKKSEKAAAYDIKIFDSLSWRRKKYAFDKDWWNPNSMSSITRRKLCLGEEEAEYTVIGEAFPFPDREDSPVINEPRRMCSLLWDHRSPAEKLMIQLSDHFPPLLWHTIKPSCEGLTRIFSEFVDVDAQHMKKHLPYYEQVQNSMETLLKEKLTETMSPSHIKNKFIEDMRKRDPRSVEMDYECEHNVYLGTVPHFRLMEDRYMKMNPFLFGWPLLLSEGNDHLHDTPLHMAAFRTIFSKSLLLLHSRLDMQVDHRLTHLLPDDNIEDVVLEMPLFCTINYPRNTRLCGGRPLVERYNSVMGTSFPTDTPVDVLATFAMEPVVKGEKELMEELRFLAAASEKAPDVERVFRLSEDQLSSNRIVGQLAYTIVYLALIGCEKTFEEDVYKQFCRHPSDLVRVACGKAAQVLGKPDLLHNLIHQEPEGRAKAMMTSALSMTGQHQK